jgi:hypothetical protein
MGQVAGELELYEPNLVIGNKDNQRPFKNIDAAFMQEYTAWN